VNLRYSYVLVVEDSLDSREMLTEYLQFRGFEVVAASNGLAALDLALAQPPALVLMDLRMPGLTGWETTRRLKAHPDTKDVIVIALTAHALTPDEGIALQAGCDAFFPKPFDIIQIGDVVQAVLERGRAGLPEKTVAGAASTGHRKRRERSSENKQ
jgi:two-component system cell cycle response regulator DivK